MQLDAEDVVLPERATPIALRRQRKLMQAVRMKPGALIIDEHGQLQAALFHANNLLWSIARQAKYELDLQIYAEPREIAGRVSKYVSSADHLQLPRCPSQDPCSLISMAPAMKTRPARRCPPVSSKCLKKIFEKMRTPGGTKTR